MTDDAKKGSPAPGALVRGVRRVLRRGPVLEGQEDKPKRSLLRRAASRARGLASHIPVQASLDKALLLISDPRITQALQQSLGAMGNLSLEAAFERDPHVQLLFSYASWCDQRAGRGQIMGLVMQDALSPQGGFANLYRPLMELGAIKDPMAALSAMHPSQKLIETLEQARRGALRTLCLMGAAATQAAPPDDHLDSQDLADWLAALPLDPEFAALPDLLMGRHASPQPEAAPQSAEPSQPPLSFLPARTLPPGLRFVISSYLMFLQLYLTRNMVDALPTMMGRVREELTAQQEREDQQRREAQHGPTLEMGPDPS
jgi:hypothetical protein